MIARDYLASVPMAPRATRMSVAASVTQSQGDTPPPVRMVIHGAPKMGKSTLASEAPAPIFISADDGLNEIDAKRFPIVQTFGDVLGAIQALTLDDHAYETCVIDHATAIQPLIYDLVCRENNWPAIHEPTWQKGYHAAHEKWRDLAASLDRLREKRGMNVIVIAQSVDLTARPKDAPEHALAAIALHAIAANFFQSWADLTLFLDVAPAGPDGQVSRVIRTTKSPSWHAGNRFCLRETMPLDSALLWREIREAQVPVPELVARARRLAAELGGETPADVEAALVPAGKTPWKLLALCRRVQDAIDAFFVENCR